MPTSPIAIELLRDVLEPMLGRARTLPAEAYTSQTVFDWESVHLFEQGWVCVGRAEDLSSAGDQRAFRIGSEGILAVRAATESSEASTTRAAIADTSCSSPQRRGTSAPSSARTTPGCTRSTAGSPRRLASATSRASTRSVSARCCAPPRVGGMGLRERRRLCPPFEEHVGNLADLIAPWEPHRLLVAETHRYEISANWKTITENYHECHHCRRSIRHCATSPPSIPAGTSPTTGCGSAGTWNSRTSPRPCRSRGVGRHADPRAR